VEVSHCPILIPSYAKLKLNWVKEAFFRNSREMRMRESINLIGIGTITSPLRIIERGEEEFLEKS